MLKEMFKKTAYIPIVRKANTDTEVLPDEEKTQEAPSVPAGLWSKCPKCNNMIYKEDVVNNSYVCPKCNGYFRIKANTRIRMIADAHSFEEWEIGLENNNPLDYPEYESKIESIKKKTHLDEAVKIGLAKIDGIDVVLGISDARFLMGSMGYVVGEKITRAIERATRERLPVILFCCSGGARMQEGIVSLMQMEKTSAAIKRHSNAGLLYIPILTDPTTGGVTASFAMLGDIILAEPGALIGFAGPRVIAQTIGQKLPEGFQSAEFLVKHGMIDSIVERPNIKNTVSTILKMHAYKKGYVNFNDTFINAANIIDTHDIVSSLKERASADVALTEAKDYIHKNSKAGENAENHPTAWERVKTARMSTRPTSLDYINHIFTDFIEMHGDRTFRDDGAIIGGIAYLAGQPVTVIGIQKGRTTKDNIIRNFGMPSPEGYRKALRLMRQAEKFNRPIINFIDTPGAFCGIEAEERGQGEAIARNLMEMSDLKVPILSIVIGEGGSGGALALAVGNEVWMLENATYSILSPEGFASILWKDSKKAQEAAGIMKITAQDLKALSIIERIIPEDTPVNEASLPELSILMKTEMIQFLRKYNAASIDEIVEQRYQRFRKM